VMQGRRHRFIRYRPSGFEAFAYGISAQNPGKSISAAVSIGMSLIDNYRSFAPASSHCHDRITELTYH